MCIGWLDFHGPVSGSAHLPQRSLSSLLGTIPVWAHFRSGRTSGARCHGMHLCRVPWPALRVTMQRSWHRGGHLCPGWLELRPLDTGPSPLNPTQSALTQIPDTPMASRCQLTSITNFMVNLHPRKCVLRPVISVEGGRELLSTLSSEKSGGFPLLGKNE